MVFPLGKSDIPGIATFVEAYREDFDLSLLTVKFKLLNKDEEIPATIKLGKPFSQATNTVGDRYPCMDSYSKTDGILSFTFEVKDSKDNNIRTEHRFITTIDIPGSAKTKLDIKIKLRGLEEAPKVSILNSVVKDDKYHVKAQVRRATGVIPKQLSTVILTTATGLKHLTPSKMTYDPKMSGALDMEFDIDNSQALPLVIHGKVVIPESRFPGTFDVAESETRIRKVDYTLRKAFLDNDELLMEYNVRWRGSPISPKQVMLPNAFATAVNVPQGPSEPRNVSYDPVTGILRFKVSVLTTRAHDMVYQFGGISTVDGFRNQFDFKVKIRGTKDWALRLTRTELTPRGLLIGHFAVNVPKGEKLVSVSVEEAIETDNLLSNKPDQVLMDTKFEVVSIRFPADVNLTQDVRYTARGYANVNNVPVPFTIDDTYESVSPITSTNFTVNKGILTVELNVPTLENYLITDVVEPRLYQNNVLSTLTPSSSKIDNNKGIIKLTYPVGELVKEAIGYRLTGNVEATGARTRYLPYRESLTKYFDQPGELKVDVVAHDISDTLENLTLKMQFSDGSYPVNVARNKVGQFYVNDRNQPLLFEYNSKTGVLETSFELPKLTGFKETFVVDGGITLPDYNITTPIPFESTTTTGSDFYPVSYKHGEMVDGVISGHIVNKNGTFPEKVEFKLVQALAVEEDTVVFHYDKDSGSFSVVGVNLRADKEDIKHVIRGDLIVTNGNEVAKLDLVGEEMSKRIPDLSGSILSIVVDEVTKEATFTYKFEWDNGIIPDTITMSHPFVSGTENIHSERYDARKGLYTYSAKLKYVEADLEVRHNVSFTDSYTQQVVVDVNYKYAPKAAATLKRAYVNKVEERLLVSWVLRDCNGNIPKDYRYTEKVWINDDGIAPGKVYMNYNKSTGVLTVDFPAKTSDDKMHYTASSKFRFPSPDVNYYPLTFDVIL